MKLPYLLAFAGLCSLSATAQPAPGPYGAVPTEAQIRWQRMEYYAFVHLGLNTYTDREWGYGDEDPKLFNPVDFDARAIVRTFKDAGMKGVILTAKHHDGFCLWPTKTTGHNITKSTWKNGKGDLVGEFSATCKAEGMKFGIYVSPWDRNHPDYAKPGYVKTFHDQIREVLTNYGPVFEIWFDGANGGDGWYGGKKERRQIPPDYYDFPGIVRMIRKLQPQCVVWGAGAEGDARWGGSEAGHVGYPHWHTLDSKNGGNSANGYPHGDRWVAAEGDTSIRHGWFWHEKEDKAVKTPEKLMQVWFDCVGRGANLILNVPPDRSGKIRPGDVESLMGFRQLRDALNAEDFALKAKTTGSARGKYTTANLTDGDIDSFWTVDDGTAQPTAEINLTKSASFNVVRLREAIRFGQRVDSFGVDAWLDGAWKEIHAGKSIGNQVLIQLPGEVTTDRLRLRITASTGVPCIAEVSLLQKPVTLAAPEIARNADGNVIITAGGGGVRYTTDGSEPQESSTAYTGPFPLPDGGVIKARAVSGGKAGPVATRTLGVAKRGWKVVAATFGEAGRAIDDNPATFWHTHGDKEEVPPQSFTVDLGRDIPIRGFTYLPRQDGTTNGMTDRYRFETSTDGSTWQVGAEGEFSNIKANPVEQSVDVRPARTSRYFRFTGLHAVAKNHITAAEVGVLAEAP